MIVDVPTLSKVTVFIKIFELPMDSQKNEFLKKF